MVSLYEFFLTAPAVKEFSLQEILEIATALRQRNRKLNITGILHYYDRAFYQILEGDKGVLTDLIENIEDPTIHGNIHFVWKGKGEGRAFSNWGLCPNLEGFEIQSEFAAQATGFSSTSLQLFTELIPVLQV